MHPGKALLKRPKEVEDPYEEHYSDEEGKVIDQLVEDLKPQQQPIQQQEGEGCQPTLAEENQSAKEGDKKSDGDKEDALLDDLLDDLLE